MGKINYYGKILRVPEYVNGKKLRDTLGIPNNRTIYATGLDGKNQLISDGNTLRIRENSFIEDVPYTEKG